jgi:hypothetical protein
LNNHNCFETIEWYWIFQGWQIVEADYIHCIFFLKSWGLAGRLESNCWLFLSNLSMRNGNVSGISMSIPEWIHPEPFMNVNY